MTGMNRLSPWIVRRAPAVPQGMGRAAAAAMPLAPTAPFGGVEPAQWLEDLRLFATGWIGGLIFFGTLLG